MLILECSRNIAEELELTTKASQNAPEDCVSYITADEFIAVFNYVLIRASELLEGFHCKFFILLQISPLSPRNLTTSVAFRPETLC
jgi:hypothetical protein